MTLAIYKVTDTFFEAIDELRQMEDEIPQHVFQQTVGALSEESAVEIGGYLKNVQIEIDAMKQYEADMRDRRKKLEDFVGRFKEHLHSEMVRTSITKISCPEFNIALRRNPESVKITCPVDKLPFEYKKVYYEPDKTKLKEALKNGICIDGVTLARTDRIEIK